MIGLEIVLHDIDQAERQLSRRRFLAVLAVGPMMTRLGSSEREFLRKVAATLIPHEASQRTGINVVANIEHLLERGSAEHRAKILRFLSWTRRIAFLYGAENVALRARGSRFLLSRKIAKGLSSLCLVAFWGDERSLDLIDVPRAEQ